MRRVLAVCLLALLAGLGTGPATASVAAFRWSPATNTQIDRVVEQQSLQYGFPTSGQERWVVNPTGCFWDVDDHRADFVSGASLAAGEAVSLTQCFVADGWQSYPQSVPAGIILTAPVPRLDVSICYRPQGRCFFVAAYPDGHRWQYLGCVLLDYDRSDPAVQWMIDGSNGGQGLLSEVVVTVANPTDRRVRDIGAQLRIGPAAGWEQFQPGASCRGRLVYDYPFAFWLG